MKKQLFHISSTGLNAKNAFNSSSYMMMCMMMTR